MSNHNSNRVFRNSALHSDHLRSPYSRNSSLRSPATSRVAPKTPGSIFSKVKRIFSPSGWLSEHDNTTMNDEDSDNSVLSDTNNPPSSNIHQTPRNPIDEFHRMQHQKIEDSPNARLADFFARKGTEPLSEIELEGVKSLLAKTNATPTTSSRYSKTIDIDEDNDSNESKIEVLKPNSAESSVKTTPSFKATYNNTVSQDNSFDQSIGSITSVRKRRVFDFSGFPSPYRTSRFKNSNFFIEKKVDTKPEISTEAQKADDTKEEKKMSNTASALLSFIESHDEDKPEENNKPNTSTTTNKIIDYSNPYASISSSHRKKKKNTIRKQTAFEQLEKSLADEQKQSEEQSRPKQQEQEADIPHLNKYKPTKSSSLRESISLNDTTDQSVDEIEVEEKEEEEKPKETQKPSSFFKIPETKSAPVQTSTAAPSTTFNSKSLFAFAPQPPKSTTTTITPPTPAPAPIEEKPKATETSTALQTAPKFSFSGSIVTKDTRPPISEFTFRFPNAVSSGYKTSDLNEQKVADYKNYFTF